MSKVALSPELNELLNNLVLHKVTRRQTQINLNKIIANIEREARASVEIYVPVRGYEGLYEVSNLGNIRSIARGRNTGRVLKQCKQFRNYLAVSLCKNNVSKSKRVHRIVAEAFISNPEGKRTVNHKDGDPTNNNINNLEWATYSEQELHSYAVLGKVNANHPDRIKELESE